MEDHHSAQSPVVIGEVLFDEFPDGHRVLGGAPFNVARHLQGFGLAPRFVSAVGCDPDGDAILAHMESLGMDIRYVRRVENVATGTVRVTIKDGSPSYEIVEDRAWDYLKASPLDTTDSDTLLYHGSLACRGEHNLALIRQWRANWPGAVLFDANLRPPHYTSARIAALAQGADWIKLNDDELAELAGAPVAFPVEIEAIRPYLQHHNAHGMVFTAGAAGAGIFTAEAQALVSPAPTPEPFVDTVGAGDAFTAAFIYGLAQRWSPSKIVERASHFACLICQQQGATPNNPHLYRNVLSTWNP